MEKYCFKNLIALSKAVFLVNNVALLEQQAKVCEATTGLPTQRFLLTFVSLVLNLVCINVSSSFCGADGVDEWTEGQWASKLRTTTVLVFIHDVFLIALSR